MRDFVEIQEAGGFQHVDDPAGELWQRFGVTEHRTYVLIDDDGSYRLTGYGSLVEDVEGLIAQ